MNIIIFGASGSLGRECVLYSLKNKYNVTGVYRKFTDIDKRLIDNTNFNYIISPLENITNFETILINKNNFEYILSCVGARKALKKNVQHVDMNINNNIINTLKNYKIDIKRFILVSGACVKTPKIDIQFCKIESEKILINSGIPYFIIRPTCYYKCFDKMISYSQKNKKIWLVGSGTYAPIYPLDTDELAEYIINNISEVQENKIISIGGEKNYSMSLLGEELRLYFERRNIECNITRIPVWLLKCARYLFSLLSFNICPLCIHISSIIELYIYYNTEGMIPDTFIPSKDFVKYIKKKID